MSFATTRIETKGDAVTAYGKLTLHGVTKDVVLTGTSLGAATDPWGNQRAGFEAKGTIDRRDFGLTWNKALEAGGVVVGEKVEIGLEVEAIKK